MTVSESENSIASLPDESDRFYWTWNEICNRPLQVFFFIKPWIGITERQKTDWLSFAQRNGQIMSSSILPLTEDKCVWTVVKKMDPLSDVLVVASKEIRIHGLSEFFESAAKKPI